MVATYGAVDVLFNESSHPTGLDIITTGHKRFEGILVKRFDIKIIYHRAGKGVTNESTRAALNLGGYVLNLDVAKLPSSLGGEAEARPMRQILLHDAIMLWSCGR